MEKKRREKDMFKSCLKLYMYIRLTEELSVSIGNTNSNAVINLFHYMKNIV